MRAGLDDETHDADSEACDRTAHVAGCLCHTHSSASGQGAGVGRTAGCGAWGHLGGHSLAR
jgi:hypothetical protein